jgi:hypothetical protein
MFKFASSVGFVQEEVVRNYILNQESHHGNSTLKCGEDVIYQKKKIKQKKEKEK